MAKRQFLQLLLGTSTRRPFIIRTPLAMHSVHRHLATAAAAGGAAAVVSSRRFFPRRAVMYVPASDERKTKKVLSLQVDTVVFDIEDGVAVNQKVSTTPIQHAG